MFEERKVSEENREKLLQHYYDKLSAAVDEGYSPKLELYDEELAKSLKYSIAEFSAFKETSFRKVVESLLTSGGHLVPWNDFKKEAMKVSGDYNARWLETEYHQTVANANMAAKWHEFKANSDLYPNLRLYSVRDARVRPEHKVLDGTIRPINDAFWDTHLPPLDWGCRCHVEQTDEEPTDVKGGVQMKIEFENNPGKTGKIFGGTAYEKSLNKNEVLNAKRRAEYINYQEDRDYIDVAFYENSGLKATHVQHKFDKVLGHYEKEVQNFFAKRGDKFILEKEANDKKYFEGFLNNESCEIKSIIGNSPGTIRKRIAQIAEKKAAVGIIYFPDKFSDSNLTKALSDYKGKLPRLIILHKNKILKDGR